MPHLFEFMDQDWLPQSLRSTLREILECVSSAPFRSYYRWVADESLAVSKEDGCKQIVELGAGTARITELMAMDPRSNGLALRPCDNNPDTAAYARLQSLFPGKVIPSMASVDFSEYQDWPAGTMVIISAALHHVPSPKRKQVIQVITGTADRVIVFEPFRRTFLSFLFAFPSLVPSFMFPLLAIRKPGIWRRIFWCWLVPVAPFMFCWDGMVSVLRQWQEKTWRRNLIDILGPNGNAQVRHTMFCQMVSWKGSQHPDKTDVTMATSSIPV